jgi:hypothetical protein
MNTVSFTNTERLLLADKWDTLGGTLYGKPARIVGLLEPFPKVATPDHWIEFSWGAIAHRVSTGNVHLT